MQTQTLPTRTRTAVTTETQPIDDRLMTVRQAADLLGVDYDTVLRWTLKGVFGRFARVGPAGSIRLYESDVRAQMRVQRMD